jgi:hypothetical protein
VKSVGGNAWLLETQKEAAITIRQIPLVPIHLLIEPRGDSLVLRFNRGTEKSSLTG